jgi:ATP-dependent exoDNAse (exonuclease V) alpha subunit
LLQRRLAGQVVIVDEAGLVSSREMRDLCRTAGRHGNRLLLVGDTKQHHSVEAGDALRALQREGRVPVFRLTEIQRQHDPRYRAAVRHLARGNTLAAFRRFEDLGAVKEHSTAQGLFCAAASDYVRTVQAGKSCLAISPVWVDIHAFTAHVRAQLQAAGLLSSGAQPRRVVAPLSWTQEERRRVRNYQPGDVLVFHSAHGAFARHDCLTVVGRGSRSLLLCDALGRPRRIDPRKASGFSVGLAQEIPVASGDRLLIRANLKEAGLRNGDLVEVARIEPDGTLALRDGRAVPPWFHQFTHGYATTSHASQGKTIDRGILLLADAGIAAANLKQAYVSNSRFRESQVIYTTDKQAAREAMKRPADRKLALELIEHRNGLPSAVAGRDRQGIAHAAGGTSAAPVRP